MYQNASHPHWRRRDVAMVVVLSDSLTALHLFYVLSRMEQGGAGMREYVLAENDTSSPAGGMGPEPSFVSPATGLPHPNAPCRLAK